MLRSLFRLQHKTSESSARMRCFTLVQGAAPAPTVALHLGLHVCSLVFHELLLCLSQIFWPRRIKLQGNTGLYFLSVQLSTRTDIRSIPSNPDNTSTRGLFHWDSAEERQPGGSSGSSFNPRVCSPSMFPLLTSLCLLKNFIMSNKRQSEEQWHRLWRPWTTLDHLFPSGVITIEDDL